MKLSDHELHVISTFHNEYFTLQNLVSLNKPDLKEFVKGENSPKKKARMRMILALYFFEFWCSSYIIRKPSDEFIKFVFKQYKSKP